MRRDRPHCGLCRLVVPGLLLAGVRVRSASAGVKFGYDRAGLGLLWGGVLEWVGLSWKAHTTHTVLLLSAQQMKPDTLTLPPPPPASYSTGAHLFLCSPFRHSIVPPPRRVQNPMLRGHTHTHMYSNQGKNQI